MRCANVNLRCAQVHCGHSMSPTSLSCVQYEFHMVLELLKTGHPEPEKKVSSASLHGLSSVPTYSTISYVAIRRSDA